MHHVQAYIIRPQPLQAELCRSCDMIARASPVIRAITHLAIELDSKDHLIPFAFKRFSCERFRLFVVVDIRRGNEVDACLPGVVDDRYRRLFICAPTEVVANRPPPRP